MQTAHGMERHQPSDSTVTHAHKHHIVTRAKLAEPPGCFVGRCWVAELAEKLRDGRSVVITRA